MKNLKYVALAKGILSYIPFSYILYKKIKKAGAHSASNPRFCYSLWLRIYVRLHELGLSNNLKNVAELGSSSSFGVGLAALICGVNSYTSLEIKEFAMVAKNIEIFEELVQLFRSKEDIPDNNEFPQINISIKSYDFPRHIFTDEVFSKLMDESRIEIIRQSILNYEKGNNDQINYYVPWEDKINILRNKFDLIFSRAVMEHIINFQEINNKLSQCLKSDGVIVHDIEYHSHKLAKYWNGHWIYPNFIWHIIIGKRPFVINRATHTDQCRVLQQIDLNIVYNERNKKTSQVEQEDLSKKFRSMSQEDLTSFGGCIIACKKYKVSEVIN